MLTASDITGDGYETRRTVHDIVDSGGNGMPNDYEDVNGLDKDDADDAGGNLDLDGMTNLDEFENYLDPRDPDSGWRLVVISSSVSPDEDISVPASAELSVISADPMPGMEGP